MDPKLAEHHEKIDQLISERKEQHETFRKHTRLITATAACFTVGILILGIFYSMLYLPIATEKVNEKLNSESIPLTSPKPTNIQDQNINTVNWKTYTSPYGYSIDVPAQWTLKEEYTTQYFRFSLYNQPDTLDSQVIVINVYNNLDNLTIEQYVKKFRSSLDTSFIPIKVNSYLAKKANIPGQCDGDTNVFLAKNDKIFELTWASCHGQNTNEDIFNHMLSTFKFTEK